MPVNCEPDAVRHVTRALLEAGDPLDAIVSTPDGTALGVLGAARDAGRRIGDDLLRRIGDDLLVASCVDSLAMQLATPPITAIDLRPREIGRDVGHVVLSVLAGEELPDTVRRARPQLELRRSTGRPARELLRPPGDGAVPVTA